MHQKRLGTTDLMDNHNIHPFKRFLSVLNVSRNIAKDKR